MIVRWRKRERKKEREMYFRKKMYLRRKIRKNIYKINESKKFRILLKIIEKRLRIKYIYYEENNYFCQR